MSMILERTENCFMDSQIFIVEIRGIDRSLYTTEVEAINKEEALNKAIRDFAKAGLDKQLPMNPKAWSRVYPK